MRHTTTTQREALQATQRHATDIDDERVHVSLHRLLLLQHQAAGFSFLPRQPVHSLLTGRHSSRIRGRGLNFEEIRAYQLGDDPRTIDWKVTARTRKPHTRVFTEERERPSLLLVDQRLNMFYGTRLNMKSVTAAEAAALAAWRVLGSGDRVGAVVFDDVDFMVHRPLRSRSHVTRILQQIVDRNHRLRADAGTPASPGMLNRALAAARGLATHDHLVVVISDFGGADETTRQALRDLTRHNDVLGVLVHDPSATELPASRHLVVTDGELQAELALGKGRIRQRVGDIAKGRIARLLAWEHEIRVPMLPLSCGEPTAEQVQRLLGRIPFRRRR